VPKLENGKTLFDWIQRLSARNGAHTSKDRRG
jgi:hypothetical protein